MKPRPHVSPALTRLRSWVMFTAAIVAMCAAIKLVVFGFVHYTEIRFTTLEPGDDSPARLTVVKPRAADVDEAPPRIERGRIISEPVTATDQAGPVDPNRVLSRGDTNMKNASAFAVGAGLLAAVVLAFLATLGTMIAAGGAVPGIDRTVSACVWSVIMLLFCIPWPDVVKSVPVPGVFTSYELIVAASAAAIERGSGEFALLASFVLVPALVMGCAVGVCFSFRAGVEAGIIATSVSEFDRAIDRELSEMQERGVTARQPKAVGALFRAIGDEIEPGSMGIGMSPTLAGIPMEMPKEDLPRSVRQSDSGRPLPRPI